MSTITAINLDDNNFAQEVLESDIPVLVDFWASWCVPCKLLAPTIESLATQYDGTVKIAKYDTTNNRDAAIKYEIKSLPTILIFKNGEVQSKLVGLVSADTISIELEKLLGD